MLGCQRAKGKGRVSVCPHCQVQNRPDRRYCSQCGAVLGGRCPHCGFRNDPGDVFCGGCGTALHDGRPQIAEPLTGRLSAPSVDGFTDGAERRHLSIMFCDLVGSTKVSEGMDAEDFRDVISAFRDTCTASIQHFGGFVARNMGDGLLAYFGYPTAHGNDAERAILAGLEIAAAIPAIKTSLSEPLRVRVGIATGLSVVGDLIGSGAAREIAVMGDTPNLAARLQAAAAPGQVLVSQETRALTLSRFEFEALQPIHLKGIAHPVTPWRVREAALGDAAARPQQRLTPFINRDAEISNLHAALNEAGHGTGQCRAIQGVAGIGKSRLLAQFLDQSGIDARHKKSLRCNEFRISSALYPIRKYVTECAGITDADTADDIRRKIDRTLKECNVGHEAEFDPFSLLYSVKLGEGADIPQEGSRTREILFEVLARLLTHQTADGPVVITVEDLHHADPSTRDFIAYLGDFVAGQPALLLVTLDEAARTPWPESLAHRTITLETLDDDHSRALLEACNVEPANIPAIIDRAGGVPLYLEEIADAVTHHHVPLDVDAVPDSLQGVLTASLDRLGPARRLAQLAAVVGRVFTRERLARTAEKAGVPFDAHLPVLIDNGILVENTGTHGLQFRHSLVRDAAYSTLLKRVRQKYHEIVIDVLLDAARTGDPVVPEEMAHHLEAAQRFDEAADYWSQAGQRSRSVWANVEAAHHLDRALTCLEKADGDGDPGRALDIRLALASVLRVIDENERALEVLDGALDIVEQTGDEAFRARILNLTGNVEFARSRINECMKSHQKALDAARRTNQPLEQAHALSGLCDGSFMLGRIVSAEEYTRQCEALCDQHGFDRLRAVNAALQGHMKVYLAELPAAEATCRGAADTARDHGWRRVEMVARGSCLAKALIEQGKAKAAKDALDTAMGLAEMLDARRFFPLYDAHMAHALWMMGQTKEALSLAQRAVARNDDNPAGYTTALAYGVLALVTPEAKMRRAHLESGMRFLGPGVVAHNHLWLHRYGIEIGMALRDAETLRRHADALDTYTRIEPVDWATLYSSSARLAADRLDGWRPDETATAIAALVGRLDDLCMLPLKNCLEGCTAAMADG